MIFATVSKKKTTENKKDIFFGGVLVLAPVFQMGPCAK
jgi:hypothetical protein